jgi:hypothetical protein
MLRIEEVDNLLDADYAIVVSENWGAKKVLHKFYYSGQDGQVTSADCVQWIASFYPQFFSPNNRIDIYNVFFGRIIGRE